MEFSTSYKALALFAGAGGFSEGMRLAGFKSVAAVELDRFAAETYRFNFPTTELFEGDVHDFLNDASPTWQGERNRFKGIKAGSVDVVYGGPPCQGFSQIGPRALDDPRNDLYKEFIRLLDALRPPVFLIENVPNMLLLAKGRFREEVLAALTDVGYTNSAVSVIDADDFGVPQTRSRAIFFGVRDDLSLGFDAEEWMEKILDQQRLPRVVVQQAIGDLPKAVSSDDAPLPYPQSRIQNWFLDEMRLDRTGKLYTPEAKQRLISDDHALRLYGHHTKEIQERRLALIKLLAPGKKADSLPPEIWNGSRPEKWRRLHPQLPAHTILAQMHRDLSEWVHPHHDRWITVREAARLQSFHDGFIFQTSEWQMLKQIGNAVPPLLAKAVGAVAREALDQIRSRAR